MEEKILDTEAVEEVVEKTPEQIAFEKEEEERLKKAKWENFWDKVGNVLLFALMAAPFAILGYIFWWFLNG